jgi:hypothetical protein
LALLAAVVATALLSAGEARAVLSVSDSVSCANVGGVSGGGTCVPETPTTIGSFGTVVFSWTIDPQNPQSDVFDIVFQESSITLLFTDNAGPFFSGAAADTIVLQLSEIEPVPDLLVEIGSVEWVSCNLLTCQPLAGPTVSNSGLPNNMAAIQWDLVGLLPTGATEARINLNFVPEPGTAALLGLGLVSLGVVGRRRRN